MKVWKYHPEECDNCGGSSEIFTDVESKEGYGFDGDPMRCLNCGAIGYWTVYDEDDAYCNWVDDSFTPEEDEETP